MLERPGPPMMSAARAIRYRGRQETSHRGTRPDPGDARSCGGNDSILIGSTGCGISLPCNLQGQAGVPRNARYSCPVRPQIPVPYASRAHDPCSGSSRVSFGYRQLHSRRMAASCAGLHWVLVPVLQVSTGRMQRPKPKYPALPLPFPSNSSRKFDATRSRVTQITGNFRFGILSSSASLRSGSAVCCTVCAADTKGRRPAFP